MLKGILNPSQEREHKDVVTNKLIKMKAALAIVSTIHH